MSSPSEVSPTTGGTQRSRSRSLSNMLRARSNTTGGSSNYGTLRDPLELPRLARQRSLQLKHNDSIAAMTKTLLKSKVSTTEIPAVATPPKSPIMTGTDSFHFLDEKSDTVRPDMKFLDPSRSLESVRLPNEVKAAPSPRSVLLHHNNLPQANLITRVLPRSHPNSIPGTPQLEPSPKFLRDTHKADAAPIVATQRPEQNRSDRPVPDRSASYCVADSRSVSDRGSFISSSIYQSPSQAGTTTTTLLPEEVDETRNLLPPLPTPQESSFPNSPSEEYGFKATMSLPVSPAYTQRASMETASLASDFEDLTLDYRLGRFRNTCIPSWIQRCDIDNTYNTESDDGDCEYFDEKDDGDNEEESEIDMYAFSMNAATDYNDLWESGAESCSAAPTVPSIKERRSFRKKKGDKTPHLQLSGLGNQVRNVGSTTSVNSAPTIFEASDIASNNIGLGFSMPNNQAPATSNSSSNLLKSFGSSLKRKVSNTTKLPKRSQFVSTKLATVPDVKPCERNCIAYSTAPSVWGGTGDDDNEKEISDYFDKAMEVIEAVKRKRSSRGNKKQQNHHQQQLGQKSSYPDSESHDDSLSESNHGGYRRQHQGDYFGMDRSLAFPSNPSSVMSTPAGACTITSIASAPGATPCTPCTPNSLSALRKEVYDGVQTNEFVDSTIRKHNGSTSHSSTEGEGNLSSLGSSMSSTHDGVATGEGGILPHELAPTEEECCNMSVDEMTCRMIASQELFESTQKRLAESGWYNQVQIDDIQKNGRLIQASWKYLIEKRRLQEKAQSAQVEVNTLK